MSSLFTEIKITIVKKTLKIINKRVQKNFGREKKEAKTQSIILNKLDIETLSNIKK